MIAFLFLACYSFEVLTLGLSLAPGAPVSGPPAPQNQIRLAYVSPSSIETFASCPRKWAWRKLDGRQGKAKPSAALGSAMHGHLERWLTHGTPVDMTSKAGEMAFASFRYLPPPRSGAVELEFTLDVYDAELGSIRLGGKVDWSGLDWLGSSRPVVLDHKSTGDFVWAKDSVEKLLAHPQAPIYAAWALGQSGANEVDLRWNYTLSKAPFPCRPSWHTITREQVSAALPEHVAVAKRIVRLVQHANETRARGESFGARDVDYNPGACHLYGGCDYQSDCRLTPEEERHAMQTHNDLMSALQAGQVPPTPQYEPPSQTHSVAAPALAAPQAPAMFQIGQIENGWQFTENPANPWVPVQAAPAPAAPPVPVFVPPPAPQAPNAPPLQYTPPASYQTAPAAPVLAPGAPPGPPPAPQYSLEHDAAIRAQYAEHAAKGQQGPPVFGPVNPPENALPPAPRTEEAPKAKAAKPDAVFLAALQGCAASATDAKMLVERARAISDAAKG